MNWSLKLEFSLVAQIGSQVYVNRTQPIQHGDLGRLKVSLLGLRSLRLNLKGPFLVIGEAKIATPHDLTSHVEVGIALSALDSSLEASLAVFSSVSAFYSAKLASLSACAALAPSGALVLASLDKRSFTLALLKATPVIIASQPEHVGAAVSSQKRFLSQCKISLSG